MLPSLLLSALATLGPWPTPPPPVDLTTIDRRIAREPAYRSKAPKYCLLVFGPEARTRVWLVLDGDTLYVDRDGSGDLTQQGKAVPFSNGWANLGDVAEADGRARHTRLRLSRFGDGVRLQVTAGGKRLTYVGFDDADRLRFADRAAEAPVVHIDGPLTMRLYDQPPVFVPGRATELNVSVGTPGLGKGTFAAIQSCAILNCRVAPVAEVSFPHCDPGREPLRVRVSIADD
jgi:hypothetical protein